MRRLGAVDGIAKLLSGFGVRIVATEVRIIGLVAVRAPGSFELTGFRVEHGDAFVQIPVGDERFRAAVIERHFGDSSEVFLVVAVTHERRLVVGRARVTAGVGFPELFDELSVAREFQDVGVAPAVAADPNVVHRIDGDPMIRLRPVVALAGTAPVVDEVALWVELEDVRCRHATLSRPRRIGRGVDLIRAQRALSMDDENVVPGIDRDPDGRPHHPMIGQRFGPKRIHFEPRGLGAALGGYRMLQRKLTDAERDESDDQTGTDDHVFLRA